MRGIQEWLKEASCSASRALFDSNPKGAKKLCKAECPVSNECFQYALIYEESGIWGGTTEEERRSIDQDHPEIRQSLINQARRLGLFELRYSIDNEYWKKHRVRSSALELD